MRPRIASLCVLGAALTLAATAAAQGTTRTDTTKKKTTSSTRIRVGKESPGEVVTPRVDTVTVTVYKTDTLTVGGITRIDTVTNTITRYDTVRVEMMPAPIRHIGGLYFGLGGGTAFPAAGQNDINRPGPRFEGMIGYDPIDFPLGLRLSGGYNQNQFHSYVQAVPNIVPGDTKMIDVSGDLKLRAPSAQPFGLHFQTYGVGGLTWNYFKNLIEPAPGGNIIGGTTTPARAGSGTYDTNWYSKMGWNAGGGASLGWGHANVFGEIRWQSFTDVKRVPTVPLVFGLTFY